MSVRIFNGIKPKVAKTSFVDKMASVIGDVSLDEHTSIWPNVSIRGDLLPIKIGFASNIQDNSVIHTTQFNNTPGQGYSVSIGSHVTVGHGAIIHGCTIGNRVLIGMGAIILDGAVIEDDCMVAAGSVIPPGKVLTSGSLYIGSPARKVRDMTQQEYEYIINNAANYKSIKDQHIKDTNYDETI